MDKAELEALHAIASRPVRQLHGRRDVVDFAAAVERKIENALAPKPLSARIPQDGKDGLNGKDGVGQRGPKGDKGDPGEQGPIPDHRWQGTKLAFQLPSGKFEEPVDLQGPPGKAGEPVQGFASGTITLAQNSYFPAGW